MTPSTWQCQGHRHPVSHRLYSLVSIKMHNWLESHQWLHLNKICSILKWGQLSLFAHFRAFRASKFTSVPARSGTACVYVSAPASSSWQIYFSLLLVVVSFAGLHSKNELLLFFASYFGWITHIQYVSLTGHSPGRSFFSSFRNVCWVAFACTVCWHSFRWRPMLVSTPRRPAISQG